MPRLRTFMLSSKIQKARKQRNVQQMLKVDKKCKPHWNQIEAMCNTNLLLLLKLMQKRFYQKRDANFYCMLPLYLFNHFIILICSKWFADVRWAFKWVMIDCLPDASWWSYAQKLHYIYNQVQEEYFSFLLFLFKKQDNQLLVPYYLYYNTFFILFS